ncbi:MAG: 2-oxo acid dehydrogenase subunit E2 [Cryobacterium sp.]|nr:2-oxo acid dehydrogenase subunit E2 [Oligoflexia bacterium]
MWISKNIELGAPLKVSRWRKISMASWKVTRDASIVSILDLDVEPALAYLAKLQTTSTAKLTLTHFAGYVLGKMFAKYPEINCLIRGGRLYPRLTADICFVVGSGKTGGEEDLAGHVVRSADQAGVVRIAEELTPGALLIRQGKDITFRGIKQYIGIFPGWIRGPLVNLADFILHGLNLWSPILGFAKDSFGSAMLTSVGSLDIEFAIPRIYPQSRNVMMVSVGAVREKPVVRNGKVVVGKVLKIVFVADHRIVDGLHAAYLLKEFQAWFENPERETSHSA